MAKILDLDVRAVVDYHSHPGVMSRTWKSKAEFHDNFYKVLTKTGEQDPTGKGIRRLMVDAPFRSVVLLLPIEGES